MEVDPHRAVPFVVRHLLHRGAGTGDGRVVHQNVHPAHRRLRVPEATGHVGGLGHIPRRAREGCVLAQRPRHGVGIDVEDVDPVAGVREPLGDHPPDPARSSGDDDGARHRLPPCEAHAPNPVERDAQGGYAAAGVALELHGEGRQGEQVQHGRAVRLRDECVGSGGVPGRRSVRSGHPHRCAGSGGFRFRCLRRVPRASGRATGWSSRRRGSRRGGGSSLRRRRRPGARTKRRGGVPGAPVDMQFGGRRRGTIRGHQLEGRDVDVPHRPEGAVPDVQQGRGRAGELVGE